MKSFILIIIGLTIAFAQDSTHVTILTTDGSEIIGIISEETDLNYTIDTPAGLTVSIPKEAIVKIDEFTGTVKEGKLFRPDPNKSLYLFSPSAYPIGKNNKYCRDFCVLFPSFNYGISDMFSAQAGIFWFPGLDIDNIPLLGSLKTSIYNNDKFALAGGAMYVRIPTIKFENDEGEDEKIHLGGGFLFITGTYGDQLNHATFSLGWGFARGDNEWEMMNRPIFVLAGNKRISQNIALVTENWIWPDLEIGYMPLSLSARFLGKKIATDVGMVFTIESIARGLPFPIINFTYHF
jgi:hypothetical protein